MTIRGPAMTKSELVARASFRRELRSFERYTEEACADAGVTMPQYLLLLQVAGCPDRDWALVGELAEWLVLRHHTTVELVTRCEAAGLVRRERDALDQRKVRVLLTRDGSRVVSRIASAHLGELERLARHLKQAARRERA